jgi:hypothetical protein
MSNIRSFAVRLLAAGAIAGAPAAVLAQQGRGVGGHVGIATPLVTVTSDDTTDIGDVFSLFVPIGVTVKLSDRLAVDFEMIVQNQVDPRGNSALVVDPGIIYNAGPVALGLRVASAIGAPANVGVIPLINRGIAPVGGGTWFIEAAFPTFLHSDPDPDVTFDVVLHTGIAF